MENITVNDIVVFLVSVGSLISAVGIILKTISRPINDIKEDIKELRISLTKLDNKVTKLQDDFDERFNKLEKRQHKQQQDLHMNIIISKYLLDCSTDTSDKNSQIKDTFNDYLLNQAIMDGDKIEDEHRF